MAPTRRRGRRDRAKPGLRLPEHQQAVRRWTSHATQDPATTSSPRRDAVIDDPRRVGRAGEPTPRCGVLRDHPVRPRRTRRDAERQEHQRVPRQRLGIPHAQPRRPGEPPLKGPAASWPTTRPASTRRSAWRRRLFAQLHHGDGEFIDRLRTSGAGFARRLHTGPVHHRRDRAGGTRDDYDQQGPASFFACRDGHVYLYMTNGRHWVQLKELMGRPPWLDEFDDDWLEFSVTPEKVETFHRGFAAWIRDQAKECRRRYGSAPRRAAGSGERRRRPAAFAAVPPSWLLPRRRTSGARHCGLPHRPVPDE